MKTGDLVIVRQAYRGRGSVGGWRWTWRYGQILKVNRVTADVYLMSYGRAEYTDGPHRVRLEHIRKERA